MASSENIVEPNASADNPPLHLLLDHRSFVPYYEQIVSQIRNLIKDQKFVEGQRFHSEGEVARMLGISKMPVRQAFQKLRSEGLLVISRGKKPVIGSGKLPWNFQELRGFSEEMRRRGLQPSAKVLLGTTRSRRRGGASAEAPGRRKSLCAKASSLRRQSTRCGGHKLSSRGGLPRNRQAEPRESIAVPNIRTGLQTQAALG